MPFLCTDLANLPKSVHRRLKPEFLKFVFSTYAIPVTACDTVIIFSKINIQTRSHTNQHYKLPNLRHSNTSFPLELQLSFSSKCVGIRSLYNVHKIWVCQSHHYIHIYIGSLSNLLLLQNSWQPKAVHLWLFYIKCIPFMLSLQFIIPFTASVIFLHREEIIIGNQSLYGFPQYEPKVNARS